MIDNQYTRRGIITLWAAVLCVLAAVTVARLEGYEPPAPPASPVLSSRDVQFEDVAAGSVNVYESESGRLLTRLAPGDGSFIRGVLRAMARERRGWEIGPSVPFRISRHIDGSLTLEDGSTGRTIDLYAFGPTNADAFARLLDAGPAGS
jgi:putative photosynthetic complex assembly protein